MPVPEEIAEVVAVHFGPFAEFVHEGLYEKGLVRENIRIHCLQLPEQVFAQADQGMVFPGEHDPGILRDEGAQAVFGVLETA